MQKTFIILISIVLLLSQAQAQQKCRALVLEGGGDLGAYEAGVLDYFVRNLPKETVQWDVFSGISIGAVTSGGINQFAKGDELAMVEWLVGLWSTVKAKDIMKNWIPGGLVQGYMYEISLINTAPMKGYLSDHLQMSQKRKITVGMTDVNTGELRRVYEDQSHDNLIQAVINSASVPILFPYQNTNGSTYVDGGVAFMLDIPGAIDRCREIVGDNVQNIVVDIVMCFGEKLPTFDPKEGNLTPEEVHKRSNQIDNYNRAMREVLEAYELFPQVEYRYLVMPTQVLPSMPLPLQFKHEQIMKAIEIGKKDAEAVIKKGEGVSFKEFLKESLETFLIQMDKLPEDDSEVEYIY